MKALSSSSRIRKVELVCMIVYKMKELWLPQGYLRNIAVKLMINSKL